MSQPSYSSGLNLFDYYFQVFIIFMFINFSIDVSILFICYSLCLLLLKFIRSDLDNIVIVASITNSALNFFFNFLHTFCPEA